MIPMAKVRANSRFLDLIKMDVLCRCLLVTIDEVEATFKIEGTDLHESKNKAREYRQLLSSYLIIHLVRQTRSPKDLYKQRLSRWSLDRSMSGCFKAMNSRSWPQRGCRC